MEFLRAIEEYCGEFTADAATEEGEGFIESYDASTKT